MANANWIGGASKTTHVMTLTYAQTWTASDTMKTDIRDENGELYSVTSTATSGTIETGVRDIHLADLQAESVKIVFAAITWTSSGTDAIVATAKITGKPLSGNNTGPLTHLIIDTSTINGDGTAVWVNTTDNSGPNDAGTAANWVTNAGATTGFPIDDEDVLFLPHPTDLDPGGNPVSYDLLYGLDVSNSDVNSLRIGRSYKGAIGDAANEWYFRLHVTSNDSAGETVIDTNSPSMWLRGNHTSLIVAGLPLGNDVLHLGAGTITTMRLIGNRVRGKITAANACVINTIISIGASMRVELGTDTVTGITTATIDGGSWISHRKFIADTSVLTILGGTFSHMIGEIVTINNYGGLLFLNSNATFAKINHFSGTTSFEQNISSGPTVTNIDLFSGQILDKSGLGNVTYSNPIKVYGGSATSDTAQTQQQA